jgi:predicted RNase H-like nuclease (RuvC/YqgF family)
MATYKIDTPEEVKSDDIKVIVKTDSIETTEKFTIAQLKHQISHLDKDIARIETEKANLQAKIDEVVSALNLTIE